MWEQAYYVTAKEYGKTFFLAGPYEEYEAARSRVSFVASIAKDHKRNANAGRAAFMSYGVTKVDSALQAKTSLGVL